MLAFTSPQRHYNTHTYPGSMYGRQPPPPDMGGDSFRELIRELSQQRARKAQWLPDEVDDSDEELDLSHIQGLKTLQNIDRTRKDHEARAAAMQEEAERARQRQMEVQDARQKAVEHLYREASERRAAALDREANLQRMHNHNPFTGGRNYSQNQPHGSSSTPINPEGTPLSSPPHKANRVPEPKSQSTPKPVYTEKHETAASVIQEKFRIHRSLQAISNIASEFQTLKTAFVYPSVIEIQEPGSEEGHISISTTRAPSEFDNVEEEWEDEGEVRMEVDGPQIKLAYTTVNYPVHSYVDAMERLLMKLDGVESWGDRSVRERRRSAVREIEKETAKLEKFWKQAWVDYVEKQGEGTHDEEEQEVQAELQEKMETDEELVHVELPKVEEDNRDDEWLDVAELAPAAPSVEGIPSSFAEGLITSSIGSTLSDNAEV